MEFKNATEAWDAVKECCDTYPDIKAKCEFGQLCIVQPYNATIGGPSLYIIGFNGSGKKYIRNGKDTLVPRFTNICNKAAYHVGVDYYIMAERCPWGSPTVGNSRNWLTVK